MRLTAFSRNYRRGLRGGARLASAAALTAMTAVLATGGPPARAALTPRLDATSPSTTEPPTELNGVSAVSQKAAWAVGCTGNDFCPGTGPLIERWNGTAWTRVKYPFPSDTQDTYLSGVSADSAVDVWVAGGLGGEPLVLHQTGTAWKQVASLLPSGAQDTSLRGVSAVSAGNAWAVGWYENSSGVQVPLVLHCTGTACKPVKSTLPSGAKGGGLNGVSAVPVTTDALATGYYTTSSGVEFPLTLHCTGTACKPVKSTLPSGAKGGGLNGVSAVLASDAWAVGWYENSSGVQVPLVLHCMDTACTSVTSHAPKGVRYDQLTGVSAVSATTGALAVGGFGATTTTSEIPPQVLRCNATACKQVTSRLTAGGTLSSLLGVSADSAKDAWAVGWYKMGSDEPYALSLHCTGTACKPVKIPGDP